MYAAEEHRHATRRIGDAERDLENVQDTLRALRVDLLQDAPAETDATSSEIRTALMLVRLALGRLEMAKSALPEPTKPQLVDELTGFGWAP